MDEKVKKKGRKDVEVMNGNVADDKEVQFLDDNQESKMKKRKKYDSSLVGMQELGFSKPSKKKRKDNGLKNNEGEDDDQGKGKQRMKKTKLGEENQHEDYNEFKSNEGKDYDQYKKKEKKKKKLSEESKIKEYNGFEINEGGDDDQGKKMKKKKKLCDKSKSKENREFNSKQMIKKKSGEERQHEDYNEFKNKEDKDDSQYKKEEKKKKKKLSEESKSKEYNEFESNEGEDGGQGKKIKKKKLRDKSKSKENSEFNSNEGDPSSVRVKSRDDNARCIVTEVDDQGKKMKTKKKAMADTGASPDPPQSGSSKPKRVTFSDEVDICCDGLVRGKRFTPEEDEKIKLAVFDYIESHGLGDEGLDMVLHCKSHPEIRDCWKEIGAALPERPNVSVYSRAHILFERGEKRKWTPEELEFLRKIQEQHGSDWKSVAEALGKHRFHVKDTWRRIKLANTNRGRWTQEEYQNLFDLVNLDLRVRASQGVRKSKHGMLRDNIGWEAIGDKLSTRTSALCCQKWYDQLTSPMVANGVWSDTDDYRLVNALFTLDACCMEEIDWDNLLEHRPGDVCRRRWNQMVQYIGEHGGKSFAEQVEILAKRFCPDLLEAREDFDGKPVVC